MRIVDDFDRNGQDAVVARLVTLFRDAPRPPRVVDRRVEPMHGYRAVHVIVFPEGVPIEVQIRTRPQHEWAESFEKLADRVGRGIRYGELPAAWMTADLVAARRHAEMVELAILVAAIVDTFERGEQQVPSSPRLPELRARVADTIARLARLIEDLDEANG